VQINSSSAVAVVPAASAAQTASVEPVADSGLPVAGFERFDLGEVTGRIGPDRSDALLQEIQDAFDDLPADPYALETQRFRRYARAVAVPWTRSISWFPATHDDTVGWAIEYYQGDHNPEFPGERRLFPAVPQSVLRNELLAEIVLADLDRVGWLDALRSNPVHVGLHFIRLFVDDAEQEAVSSPNRLHQDGEPFTFAHLIRRRNVVGGVNVIAPPRFAGLLPHEVSEELITASFTLEEPLESYVVYDPKVSHYVSPVRAAELGPGERCVLLIDFTPLVPNI
jgi:hypothetical protein